MDYIRHNYRTSDGSMTVDFLFYNLGLLKGWRIYIISNIDYGDKNISGHATHRNHFPEDTYPSICWNKRISTLEKARAVASVWADVTALYIKGRGSFDAIARQL